MFSLFYTNLQFYLFPVLVFEGRILILFIPVPGHCLLFTLQSLVSENLVKFLNFRTPENVAAIYQIQTKRPNLRVFHQKYANGTANSEDPDQTSPLGAVCSGSALFAHTYLSEDLGSLLYAPFLSL